MRLVNSFKSDISAIKNYGLISHLKYITDIDHVIVNLHFNLNFVAPKVNLENLHEECIDINDDKKIQIWCDIVNDAFQFDKKYTVDSARKYLLNHLYKIVEKVFLVKYKGVYVGAFFIGHFKKNKRVACAGRFAVKRNMQGNRIGEYLVTTAMEMMRQDGYVVYEETFNLKRDYSIRLFIRCGGIPEFDENELMLKPTRKLFFIKYFAQKKVKNIFCSEMQKRFNRHI